MSAIALKDGYTAAWFREQSILAKDAKVARRLLSLAAIKEGYSRSKAAKIGGMDRQTLCDWVHRFNAGGVAGLKDRHAGGIPRALTAKQTAWVISMVEMGPLPEVHGLVRWRVQDLCDLVQDEFGVTIKTTAMRRVLKEQGYANLTARPMGRGQAPSAIETFKKTGQASWQQSKPNSHREHR